ncbi:hypothetical protein ALC56_09898 [Trachymyrmex septentrionalis]|uniref:Uncharacterized protein n=1 Tax=Trachymyrmex septentrionalis TaxID=34720 RepID=A0A151JU29_9HYME|nr:hypothetical protein ALC56_09898 [Trachymyrmex septentrionalis]
MITNAVHGSTMLLLRLLRNTLRKADTTRLRRANVRAEVGALRDSGSRIRVACNRIANRPRCRGFLTIERPACGATTNIIFDDGFIEGETSPAAKTAGLSETTAPILVVIVAVAMAYVLWRVFMKKYSKVRLGIRNLPVSLISYYILYYPYVCDLFTPCCHRQLYQHAGPSDPLVICHFYVRTFNRIVAYTPHYFHSGKEPTPGEFDYPRVDKGRGFFPLGDPGYEPALFLTNVEPSICQERLSERRNPVWNLDGLSSASGFPHSRSDSSYPGACVRRWADAAVHAKDMYPRARIIRTMRSSERPFRCDAGMPRWEYKVRALSFCPSSTSSSALSSSSSPSSSPSPSPSSPSSSSSSSFAPWKSMIET